MTQQVKNPRAMQETQEMRVRSLYIRDTQGGYWILQYPLEEEMATTVVFLREKPHGQRSLVCYSPVGHEELDMTEQLSAHMLDYQRKIVNLKVEGSLERDY